MIDIAGDCVTWTFPPQARVVHTVRARVRGQLGHWGVGALADLATLLVSELVTNSLQYAGGPIGVRLVCPSPHPGALLVEVSDSLPDLPSCRAPAADDERGRGLRLVADTTRRWGVRQAGPGKAVWFELSLPG